MKSLPQAKLLSLIVGVTAVLALSSPSAEAQTKRKNPASKLYVSDVAGEADIDTGDAVDDLAKRSVYSAEGTVIQTKKANGADDKGPHYTTMVYSNGTGAYFDEDTRVEIRKFNQEPFVPTRSDNEVEPSISQTQAFVPRGTVGLCNSKLVAGSNMIYATPQGSVNIRGQKVVIQAQNGETKVSMLEGDSTVRAGVSDMGGHTVHTGEQAIIRAGAPGQPNIIEIHKIPHAEMSKLDDKVSMACMAKKTVYFDVRGRQSSNANKNGESDGGSTGGSGEVSAFDTESATSRLAGGLINTGNGEIVAIPLAPTNLPVQYTTSPAALLLPNGKVITPGNGTPTPGAGNGSG